MNGEANNPESLRSLLIVRAGHSYALLKKSTISENYGNVEKNATLAPLPADCITCEGDKKYRFEFATVMCMKIGYGYVTKIVFFDEQISKCQGCKQA